MTTRLILWELEKNIADEKQTKANNIWEFIRMAQRQNETIVSHCWLRQELLYWWCAARSTAAATCCDFLTQQCHHTCFKSLHTLTTLCGLGNLTNSRQLRDHSLHWWSVLTSWISVEESKSGNVKKGFICIVVATLSDNSFFFLQCTVMCWW